MKITSRLLASILITSTLILSVGCSSKNNDDTSTDASTTNVIAKSNEKEVYELYKELYPKVKELYKQYGFTDSNYEEYGEINNKYYSGPEGMLYEIFDNINHGDIVNARYTVDYSSGEATEVFADLYMEVNSDQIANNGFKIEDTFFAAMDKLMIGEDIDYTELNNNIVDAYKNGGYYDETIEYKNGNCRITTDSTMIQYTIGIYPE